jgi:hypothetical protein
MSRVGKYPRPVGTSDMICEDTSFRNAWHGRAENKINQQP